MRILRGAGVTLLALATLAGCDTEQPTQSGSQNATLDFASYTTGLFFDIWEQYRDVDHDGVFNPKVDTFDKFFCGESYVTQPATNPPQTPAPFLFFPALWAFSVEVKVVRAGQVTVEHLIPATGPTNIPEWQDDLTSYSTAPPYEPFPEAPAEGDLTQYVYANPRRMVNTSSTVMARCYGITSLPEPNLAGNPLPFEFSLQPGDTVVVTARRSATPLVSAWAAGPFSFDAALALDGINVHPEGSTSTLEVNGTISFSYQVR